MTVAPSGATVMRPDCGGIMSLCRECRGHLSRDHPYCLHCRARRPGARFEDCVAAALRRVDDPASGLAVAAPVVTIGRAPENDLVLDHPSVSRRHAEVRRTPNGFTITDLGSANGVEVDGRVVARGGPAPLGDAAIV